MRIALVNTSSDRKNNSVKDLLYGCWCQGKRIGGSTFPPLNLLLIGTILEKKNLVKIIDNNILKLEQDDLAKYLSKFHLIILPTTAFCYEDDVKFLKKVKNSNPKVKCIIFGPYPTILPEKALRSEIIDIGIIGEPDNVALNLVKKIENKQDLRGIQGICYREKDKIINTGKAPYINNLDNIPIPNRNYIEDIYYFNPLVRNQDWTTALTSRGCPASCNFCLSPIFYGRTYRYQSPSRMIEEVIYLLNNGYNEIFYRDETFTGNKKRIEKFCQKIIRKKIKIDWICNIRVNTVNKKLLKLMRLAGCHYIKIGVESGSQLILENLNKGITLSQIQKTFEWTKSLGIRTHAHMILGTKGETKRTVKKSINFLKKIKPTTVTFNLFTPFHGTPIYNKLEKEMTIHEDSKLNFQEIFSKPTGNQYYTKFSYEELQHLIPAAYKNFYLRPEYLLAKIMELETFFDLKRVIKSGINTLSFMFSKD